MTPIMGFNSFIISKHTFIADILIETISICGVLLMNERWRIPIPNHLVAVYCKINGIGMYK